MKDTSGYENSASFGGKRAAMGFGDAPYVASIPSPMMIRLTLPRLAWALLLVPSVFPVQVDAQEDGLFTLYFVRHSEKEQVASDPGLTPCGIERSESLSTFFAAVPLKAVYSTDFRRTQGTALPTATAKGLEIQSYNPRALEEAMEMLLERGQDALVVGHSNTTGVLAGLLVGEDIGAYNESIYNRIYQVVVSPSDRRLHVFHTAFACNGQ